MNYAFTGDYKRKLHGYIDKLFHTYKTRNTSRQERLETCEDITDEYVRQTGERPDGVALERLATLILQDELTDRHPDKMTREEYPLLSDSQRDEREKDEVSFQWAEEVGTDGRDYKLPTRENMRKLRKSP